MWFQFSNPSLIRISSKLNHSETRIGHERHPCWLICTKITPFGYDIMNQKNITTRRQFTITRNIVSTLRPSLSSAFFNSSWQPLNRSNKTWQWCNSILFCVSNLSARAPLMSLYETKRAYSTPNQEMSSKIPHFQQITKGDSDKQG
jgi:hypothetical protein